MGPLGKVLSFPHPLKGTWIPAFMDSVLIQVSFKYQPTNTSEFSIHPFNKLLTLWDHSHSLESSPYSKILNDLLLEMIFHPVNIHKFQELYSIFGGL